MPQNQYPLEARCLDARYLQQQSILAHLHALFLITNQKRPSTNPLGPNHP